MMGPIRSALGPIRIMVCGAQGPLRKKIILNLCDPMLTNELLRYSPESNSTENAYARGINIWHEFQIY